MKKKVFVDGSSGTTGLKIFDRLKDRTDIELLVLDEEHRKDPASIKNMINKSDVTILCLPDDASKEAVTMVDNPNTVIIDTSTAFRTNPDFIYGFAELGGFENKIKNSKRIANPGCHASGFIALIYPLVSKGIMSKNAKLSCFSLTGYSGGGKKMIEEYEGEDRDTLLDSPRVYGLNQNHKHLKEMKAICGLESEPVFIPVVGDFYSGMEVTIPLFKGDVNLTKEELIKFYENYYNSDIVHVNQDAEGNFMASNKLSGLDVMEISVQGNDERMTLVARYDNLGKGASGSAIENLNIVLGQEKTTSLKLK